MASFGYELLAALQEILDEFEEAGEGGDRVANHHRRTVRRIRRAHRARYVIVNALPPDPTMVDLSVRPVSCLFCGALEMVEIHEIWDHELMLHTCCESLHEQIVYEMLRGNQPENSVNQGEIPCRGAFWTGWSRPCRYWGFPV